MTNSRAIKILSDSEDFTLKVGGMLGNSVEEGQVICLEGDLGAGKTVFARGIAKGMGINEHVTSPTFVLVNEYCSDKCLYHFDFYRLQGEKEFYDTGLDEYFDGSGVVVVEWADRIPGVIPEGHIKVSIVQGNNKDSREICVLFPEWGYAETEKKFRTGMEGLR